MKGSQKIHHKGKVHLALAASSARAQWRRKLSDTGEPRVWWIHNDEQNFHFHFSQWLHPEEISPLSLLFKESNWEKPYCFEDDLLYKFYIMASFVILNAMGIILLLTEQQWVIFLLASPPPLQYDILLRQYCNTIQYTGTFVLLLLVIPLLWGWKPTTAVVAWPQQPTAETEHEGGPSQWSNLISAFMWSCG